MKNIISRISIENHGERITIKTTNGKVFKIVDNGQLCCEFRYFTTDDNLTSFFGSEFMGVEQTGFTSNSEDYDEHDISFLVIHTSLGVVSFEAHNVHNGYYAGFQIDVIEN